MPDLSDPCANYLVRVDIFDFLVNPSSGFVIRTQPGGQWILFPHHVVDHFEFVRDHFPLIYGETDCILYSLNLLSVIPENHFDTVLARILKRLIDIQGHPRMTSVCKPQLLSMVQVIATARGLDGAKIKKHCQTTLNNLLAAKELAA